MRPWGRARWETIREQGNQLRDILTHTEKDDTSRHEDPAAIVADVHALLPLQGNGETTPLLGHMGAHVYTILEARVHWGLEKRGNKLGDCF